MFKKKIYLFLFIFYKKIIYFYLFLSLFFSIFYKKIKGKQDHCGNICPCFCKNSAFVLIMLGSMELQFSLSSQVYGDSHC